MSEPPDQIRFPGTIFDVGPWRVEPDRNTIFRGDEERHLEHRLMQTLIYLAEHQGQTLSREQFFNNVWHGKVVNEEALSRAISLLRTALGDHAHRPKFIQTIPGVGYRLIADVVIGSGKTMAAPLSPSPTGNSIAVLPFVNLSDDPANEYFSDGISEEILNVLVQGKIFKVVGRTSSFAFKGKSEDLRKIGKSLGVAYVLEGSVRKVGLRVRITAQLVQAQDGFHLWSKTFDRELQDVFAIQDEIASAVLEALKITLVGKTTEPRIIGNTEDTEAYRAYLQGLHDRNRGSFKDTLQKAMKSFEQAVALDPGYAKAWAALAFTYGDLIWNSFIEFQEGSNRMHEASSMAVRLAPEMADGHLAMGKYWQMGWPNWQKTLAALGTALRLNPGNAEALVEWARTNVNLGHWDNAVSAARKALSMEPISVYVSHLMGHILYFSRHYEEAIVALRRTLDLNPNFPKPRYFIAMAHHWMGDSETAWKVIQDEPLEWMKLCASAVILHKLNRINEAGDALACLVEMGLEETNYIQQADVYAQLGECDQAIECLDKAIDMRDPGLVQLLVDPFLDPIRDDPRFKVIFSKAGFEQA